MNHPSHRNLPLLPFLTCERWYAEDHLHGADYIIFHFVKAEFVRDFGPWKAGHKPADLRFDFQRGELQEFNDYDEASDLFKCLQKCQVNVSPVGP